MPVVLVAAAATAALAGCGQDARPLAERTDGGNAARAAVLDYAGHRYHGYGDLRRDPTTTGRTGTAAVPPCADGGGEAGRRRVAVAELADVSMRRAVLADGTLYVRTDRPFPQAARRWFVAPRCERRGRFELTGHWIGVRTTREPRFDGDLRAPYRLDLHVTEGPAEYVASTVEVRATTRTEPGLGPHDVRRSLGRDGRLVARVECSHGGFVARSLVSTR